MITAPSGVEADTDFSPLLNQDHIFLLSSNSTNQSPRIALNVIIVSNLSQCINCFCQLLTLFFR